MDDDALVRVRFRELPNCGLNLDQRVALLCRKLGQPYEPIDWEAIAGRGFPPSSTRYDAFGRPTPRLDYRISLGQDMREYYSQRNRNLGAGYEYWLADCDRYGIPTKTDELDWNDLDYLAALPGTAGVWKQGPFVAGEEATYSITNGDRGEEGMLLGFTSDLDASQIAPFSNWTPQQWAAHQAVKNIKYEEYKVFPILDDVLLANMGHPMTASGTVYYTPERGTYTVFGFYPSYPRPGDENGWYAQGEKLYRQDRMRGIPDIED